MSSHTIGHCLPVILLAPEERERKESENKREKVGVEFP
jgi:hypothetical protein